MRSEDGRQSVAISPPMPMALKRHRSEGDMPVVQASIRVDLSTEDRMTSVQERGWAHANLDVSAPTGHLPGSCIAHCCSPTPIATHKRVF